MKNVLLKNHIMNSTSAYEKALIGLDEPSLSYNYQFSRSITGQRGKYSKIDINKLKPLEPIPFNYKGIEFNMITCPAGGKVKIEDWGSQEIKEPFMLGENEVTQELFEAVMGFDYSYFKDSNKNPVENVTWFDCLEFCNRLSDYFDLDHCYLLRDKKFTSSYYPLSIQETEFTFIEGANGFRLPKEWEWQIAAMAGTNNQYAGANDDESLKRVAWFGENSGNKTHPVAQKIPNEWGFYDMSGNLWELCENADDFYNNDAPSANRVALGGDWSNGASGFRSATRNTNSSSFRIAFVGFRVARSI